MPQEGAFRLCDAPEVVAAFAGSRTAFVGFEPSEYRRIAALCQRLRGLSGDYPIDASPSTEEIRTSTAVVLHLAPNIPPKSSLVAKYVRDLSAPLIAAGEMEQLFRRALVRARAAEVVVRPFNEEQLLFHVWRAMARSSAGVIEPDTESQGVRILVADDDQSITSLAAGILRGHGFDCHVAHDGCQALELARLRMPDLILLDVGMPHLNGFDVLKTLRADPGTAAIKVVMFTSADAREDVLRGIELGANGYFCKPFRPFDLLRRIREMFPEPAVTKGYRARPWNPRMAL